MSEARIARVREGVTLIAIEETNVLGAKAYRATCMHCPWECHRQPHDRQSTAVRHADGHDCSAQTC
jgi:hypothetical protein